MQGLTTLAFLVRQQEEEEEEEEEEEAQELELALLPQPQLVRKSVHPWLDQFL